MEPGWWRRRGTAQPAYSAQSASAEVASVSYNSVPPPTGTASTPNHTSVKLNVAIPRNQRIFQNGRLWDNQANGGSRAPNQFASQQSSAPAYLQANVGSTNTTTANNNNYNNGAVQAAPNAPPPPALHASGAAAAAAQAGAQGGNRSWPPALRLYVERAFALCKDEVSRKLIQDNLKGLIFDANVKVRGGQLRRASLRARVPWKLRFQVSRRRLASWRLFQPAKRDWIARTLLRALYLPGPLAIVLDGCAVFRQKSPSSDICTMVSVRSVWQIES